ncbi:MAG: HPr(Ser) kinase/phosphatase [Myxococcales bacterium]|nr:HPr(Ser) kinase/phosphatase [Myxococcales bacterium]
MTEIPLPTTPLGRRSVTVRELVEDRALAVGLALVAGAAGLERLVRGARIQKSGLALAGHFYGIKADRIQILGRTEQSYLALLAPGARARALERFFALEPCCVVLTARSSRRPPPGAEVGSDPEAGAEVTRAASGEDRTTVPLGELAAAAEAAATPLIVSSDRSSQTIVALHALLDDRLAPRVRVHGVLVDVFGVGLLLLGTSGVGKSEAALDLVMRGHRLVADDVVECDYRPPGMVFGAPADMLRYHLEVRGLGILNIKDLFGVTAIRERKRIDVVVRMVEGAVDHEHDRLGLDERSCTILGVDVPELCIPVRAGRDRASILEIAARNELLRAAGHHAGRSLTERIDALAAGQQVARRGQESAYPPALGPRAARAEDGDATATGETPADVRLPSAPRVPSGAARVRLRGMPTPAPESQAGRPPRRRR